MGWDEELEGIRARREAARELGGEEAVARHHARGRCTVRERIERLLDPGSFAEHGSLAGHGETDAQGRLVRFTPANYVLGIGRIEGRPVVVGGEDFTQRGGSPSPVGLRKSVYAETLAVQLRMPLVRLLEGAGGSVPRPGSGARPPAPVGDPVYAPHRFRSIARAMATAPVASAALGAVAGLPAARLVGSHFAVMVTDAQVMIGGPALVERALGHTLTKDELGGARVHARSGVVDQVADSEDDALARIRRFLSYLPANVWHTPPVADGEDDPDRRDEALATLVPRERRRVYDVRRLLAGVLDRGTLFELGRDHGRSQVTALARLAGHPVGVWANDPRFYAGAMTAKGARKVTRFVELCDAFHLPVVAFVDEPGFMIGPDAEREATIRAGTAALFAVMEARVPWASVIVRKAYGVAAGAHFADGAYVLAWPSAETGALPVEGGVAVAFRREIAAAADPDARRAELEEALAAGRSPFPRAESFSVHDLIDPRDTRAALVRWLGWVWPLLEHQLGPPPRAPRP